MLGKASQNQIRPVALGYTVQSSTYGATIPVIFGRTKSALYCIWQANYRQGGPGLPGAGSGKKGKGGKTKKGKGAPQYEQNVDFLLCHNPILGVLQFWENQSTNFPLNFVRYAGGFTIPDPQFYAIVGITVTEGYSFTINDYGSQGPQTFAGSWEVPCWNTYFHGPDPTDSGQYLYFPYTYYWDPTLGNTWRADKASHLGFGGNIYYAELWPGGSSAYGKKGTGTAVPAGALFLTFESVLGEGPEFSGNDNNTGQPLNQQQILYPMYAGLGSQDLQLGSSTTMPQIQPEVLGTGPIYATGDAEFADILESIIKQGQTQAGLAVQYNVDANGNIVTGGGGPLTTPAWSQVQSGLGAYDYPGPVQKKYVIAVEAFQMTPPLLFDQPNTAGNILVCACTGGFLGSAADISDTAGNVWNPVFPTGLGFQVWWAIAVAAPAGNAVTVVALEYNGSETLMEIAGVDTFDAASFVTGGQATVATTTTNAQNNASYILGIAMYNGIVQPSDPQNPLWQMILGGSSIYSVPDGNIVSHQSIQTRTVYNPGTYTLTVQPQPGVGGALPDGLCLLSFKATQPNLLPRSLGNLLDHDTLINTRQQCRAFGLYGSLVLDSQQKASDWMTPLLQCMNAAPVWSGFRLKVVAKSEASFAGNGCFYVSPTSPGPVAVLQQSDFIVESSTDPFVVCERKARTDVPNILQVQFPNRTSEYDDVTISQPETGSIALYSPRKDSPKQFRMLQDSAIARKVLQVMVQEQNYLLNTYKFTLNAKRKLLEPMDLVTIPDLITGLNTDSFGNNTSIPIRLTSVNENEKFQLECEAEDFIYGAHTPLDLPVTEVTHFGSQTGQAPSVNPPVIFEPVPRMLAQQNQGQVWCVVSQAFVPSPVAAPTATPGTGGTLAAGTYYAMVTYINANGAESKVSPESAAITVAANGDIVIASPPSNPYAVAFNVYVGYSVSGSETLQNASPIAIGTNYTLNALAAGTLPPPGTYGGCIAYISTDGGNSYNPIGQTLGSAVTGITKADWPIANDPDTTNNLLLDLTECGGELSSYTAADEDNFVYPCYVNVGTTCVPYELMSYAVATLTSAYHYTLSATGGNHLRRSVFGAPTTGVGVDHPSGSRFAFLPPSGAGIIKINMDPLWIGRTIYFKFQPLNNFGGGAPPLADLTAYPYTPTGCPSGTQNPNNDYVQTPFAALSRTSPTVITLVPVAEQFPSNLAKYQGRTFTIPTPLAVTTYYITIADPAELGDIQLAAPLPSTCQTSDALVGTPGNIYVGFLQVGPSGIAFDINGPGGWPPPFTVIVGA